MKKCFLIGFPFLLLFLSCNTLLADQASNKQDTLTIDQQINQTVGPVADAISNVIFYPIPIKAPVTAAFDGQIKTIDREESQFVRVRVANESGRDSTYQIPASRQIDLAKGQSVGKAEALSDPLVAVPFVVVWLIIGGLVFTIGFKFLNVRKFKFAIDIVRGKYSDPNESGEVSHFQALTAALSATVGLGNIAGVAIAISIGGPGAIVWMILAGLLGMSMKFVECTLGVRYRQIDERGTVYGGPMYYLSQGLKEKGYTGLGKALAVLFAVTAIGASFGGGNMFQVNQAYSQFQTNLAPDFPGWIFGLIMAILIGIVIIGGIKSIARVTEKVVPLMTGIYFTAGIIILVVSYQQIPDALVAIYNGAFSSKAVYGGFVGVLIIGFQRAAFSNEAGIGSAPIAHSAVKTNNPASEGLVGLLEPFIDTIIVCSMTALVIIVTDNYQFQQDVEGVTLTSQAFASIFPWFDLVLTVAVIFFAFSTMISWSYYGQQAWAYLFGKGRLADLIYKALFCIFVVIGAALSLGKVFTFSDAMIFAMCFPNVLGLYILAPEANKLLKGYVQKIQSGEIQKR